MPQASEADRVASQPFAGQGTFRWRRKGSILGRGSLQDHGILGLAVLSHVAGAIARDSTQNDTVIPLKVTNSCADTIWPGILIQGGEGPGTGGFELLPHKSRSLLVGPAWEGRVWGRTNCSFSENGTGPGSAGGWNGGGAACRTGDCSGRLNCSLAGAAPATLAEFNLMGGAEGTQTFYDMSLVDGYNLPLAIVHIPAANTSDIPPNLTNCACIATSGHLASASRIGTAYTNATYPTPWEPSQTNPRLRRWCPWDLQLSPPSKPGDGVYPYPDDSIPRPDFDPCLSACAATGSDEDCCGAGSSSSDADTCSPSLYSRRAKEVCPDAYAFAYDDAKSTFVVPAGGGWEVVFCPRGRSSDVLATFGEQLRQVAAAAGGGGVPDEVRDAARNVTYIEMRAGAATAARSGGVATGLVLALSWAVVFCSGWLLG